MAPTLWVPTSGPAYGSALLDVGPVLVGLFYVGSSVRLPRVYIRLICGYIEFAVNNGPRSFVYILILYTYYSLMIFRNAATQE